ncbi:MAG: LysR family transcriptional regulator [Solirubrobacterales bacterium]|nr:LysR family transcriptional regulator [Solirubrobacterales bacterium]
MELRHLRYFVAIAEERSFTAAAERLWVAQPGLSTQIRRLEAELGVRLFERHARGVDLTGAGALFLERARAALAAVDAASSVGSDLQGGVTGTLRIGLATPTRWSGTAALLERFARERDGVELTVLEGHGGTLWHDLRDGRLDAVIAPSTFASPDLRTLELGTEPWVVLLAESHRLAGNASVGTRELQGERVAVTAQRDGAGHDRMVADVLGDLGVTAAMIRTGPGPALYRSVECGDTIALTTAPATLPPGVEARPLNTPRQVEFELLWRDETPSPALAEFVRTTAESLADGATARRHLRAVA